MKIIQLKNYSVDKILTIIDQNTNLYGYTPQIETIDSKFNKEFTKYLVSISEYHIVDQLKGIKRESVNLKISEIEHLFNNGISCGIKVEPEPRMRVSEYEMWDDGYIEGFIRTMGEIDFFVWSYIKMDKLKTIIEQYKDKLQMWDYADISS